MIRSLIAILVLCYSFAFGAEIKFLIGDVTVNGKQAKQSQKVFAADTVKTRSESSVDILLSAGTCVRLKEHTSLVIQDIEPKKQKTKLRLLTGHLQSIVKKKSDFRIFTPTGVASIRGTIMYAYVSPQSTYFCTCNGKVQYRATNGKTQEVSAPHHSAILLDSKGNISKAAMKYHTDVEIFDLLYKIDP